MQHDGARKGFQLEKFINLHFRPITKRSRMEPNNGTLKHLVQAWQPHGRQAGHEAGVEARGLLTPTGGGEVARNSLPRAG